MTFVDFQIYINVFKYINLGNQLHYKKYNQKLQHVEYFDGK